MIPPRKKTSSDKGKKSKSKKTVSSNSPKMEKRSISTKEEDIVKQAQLQEKIISKKKVLFTDIDAEITGIYDKLKKYKMKNIYIVVPKQAILFQSIVNLRILKRKAEDINKNIYIITNDKNGMLLARRAGFTVFDKLEGDEHPSLVSGKLKDDQLKITPLEASINSFEDDTPKRLKSKKLSIAELIRRSQKNKETPNKRKNNSIKTSKKKKKEKNRYVLVSPNRQALTILITVTVLILILITYIALPGATIYLTPKSDTITVTKNITLADAQANAGYLDTHPMDVIPSFPVELNISKTMTYYTTGNKFQGKNATGTIKIYNTSAREWPLIEQTRFQTDDGLVFRIQKGVTVPPSTLGGAGEAEAFVVADELDANGQIIGERGNIETTKFFLPGLSESNRSKIYAENENSFSGGETITHKMVSEEDMEAAANKMRAELINSAEDELKQEVLRMNDERNIELILLTGNGAIEIGEPEVSVPENLVGEMIEQFDVSGSLRVKGIAYNYNELVNILRNKLKLNKSPEKILVKIDTESISLRIKTQEEGDNPTQLTVTATIKGIEQYELDLDSENGKRIAENIKNHIQGLSIDEAENFIQQLKEINKVEISSWPAWSPNIPSVPDNIKIVVSQEI